jgi:hypothetical protein
MVTKDDVIRSLDGLPVESLTEVRRFVEFVRFKVKPRRVALSAEQIRARLMETFGMWADRIDVPADGVEYVNQLRQGRRLRELGIVSDSD